MVCITNIHVMAHQRCVVWYIRKQMFEFVNHISHLHSFMAAEMTQVFIQL